MADEAKTLEEQIDEMIEDQGEAPSEEVEDESTDEVTEDTVEEPDGEPAGEVAESEPEDEPEEEPVPAEGEVEEPVEEEPGEVEEDAVDEGVDEVSELRNRMNKMAEAALRQGVLLPADLLGIEDPEPDTSETPAVPQQPVVQQPQPQPVAPSSYEDFKILMDGVQFDDFMDNEENFVKGMRNILSQHEQMLSQRFMSAIPSIVQNQVNQTTALQRAVDDFYSHNEDLREVRPTVGAVANQIQARHPDWDVQRVMVESAKTTRKLLRMPSPSVAKRSKVVRPSFAKQGGSQRNKPKQKMSKLQQEIDELLE
jgi:hypothetical protein